MLPGVGASLLPVGLCPACWPVYAGVLGAVGLGFLLDTRYMLPVTVMLMAIAVGSLAFRARQRRGFIPFALSVVASAIVLISKFILISNAAMYAGIALLVAASVWNAWPHRAAVPARCRRGNGCGCTNSRA